MNRLVRLLLRLFPRGFREEFGGEMLDQVARDHARARARGRVATLGFALRVGVDLMRGGLAERWRPTWNSRWTIKKERKMTELIAGWSADLRHAARTLRRTPAFTTMAVGTLALAIGTLAGMFAVVNRVILEPLPYAQPDRLVVIAASAPGSDLPAEFGPTAEFFLEYREGSRFLEDVGTFNDFTNTFRLGDRVERIRMAIATPSLFTTLGVSPILGRLPVPEDEVGVMVLSHSLWQAWFGGDSTVIGQSHEVSGVSRVIIGVMGPSFAFPSADTQLWMPNIIRTEQIQPGRFGLNLVGRMAAGVTTDDLADELTALARRAPEKYSASARYAEIVAQHRAVVRPVLDQLLGSARGALWVLLGSAGIVLLIACANVANLFLVRAEGRVRDLAVRRAIGATRAQLIRLQLSEALVVATAAGVLAVLLASVTLPLFLRVAPPGIPRLDLVGIDPWTIAFTIGAVLLAAVACGVIPAMRASAPDLARLRDGGRGATGGHHWIRNALVVGQTALALVLLIGSGLLVRSFGHLRQVDPGYDTTDVFTFQFAPEQAHLTDGPSWARFHLDFLERLAALPGVVSVGIVENVPLNEGTTSTRFLNEEMGGDRDAAALLNITFAAGDYFSTMGVDLQEGRTFEHRDHLSEPGSVILSRRAADMLWPGQSALGRRVQRTGQDHWDTVIGVVEDVKQSDFRQESSALLYYPLAGPTPTSWALSSPAYVVRTPRAETIAPEIRELVRSVAPEAPMYRTFTMAELAADSMVQLSFTMLTLGLVSTLALVLGAVGLYGVLSYVVAERTREIGVRMALGARPGQVRQMVVVQGARVVAAGVGIGIGVAALTTRALERLLFGVQGLDPATFVGVSLTMVVVGVLASYLPARRASMVDPIWSMRSE